MANDRNGAGATKPEGSEPAIVENWNKQRREGTRNGLENRAKSDVVTRIEGLYGADDEPAEGRFPDEKAANRHESR
jgi:hypothetical protein